MVPDGIRIIVVPDGIRIIVVPESIRIIVVPDGIRIIVAVEDGRITLMKGSNLDYRYSASPRMSAERTRSP